MDGEKATYALVILRERRVLCPNVGSGRSRKATAMTGAGCAQWSHGQDLKNPDSIRKNEERTNDRMREMAPAGYENGPISA